MMMSTTTQTAMVITTTTVMVTMMVDFYSALFLTVQPYGIHYDHDGDHGETLSI